MGNYDNGDFDENLKIGKYHEELVLEWAKSKKIIIVNFILWVKVRLK